MSLSLWRNFGDVFDDQCRHSHDLHPLWRRRPLNGDFGFGLFPRDLLAPFDRHSRNLMNMDAEEMAPTVGKDGFQVCVDVQQFSPSEITVRTVDNSVIIEGKHEERQDHHGFISRQFCRRYILPSGYDPNSIVSELSSDGVLTVKAPIPKAIEDNKNERVVAIQQTGPARLNVKENKAIQ